VIVYIHGTRVRVYVGCNGVARPLRCVYVGHGTWLQIAVWERDEELCYFWLIGGIER